MKTDEIVETLLSQYGIDGIRVINNSTSSSISYPISNEFFTVGLMAVKKKDKKLNWQTRYNIFVERTTARFGTIVDLDYALNSKIRDSIWTSIVDNGLDKLAYNGIIDTTHKRWQDSSMDDARHRVHDIVGKHLIEEASKGKAITLSLISGEYMQDSEQIKLIDPYETYERLAIKIDLVGKEYGNVAS